MKHLLFFILSLFTIPLQAQYKGCVLEDANGYPSIGINAGSIFSGDGTYHHHYRWIHQALPNY